MEKLTKQDLKRPDVFIEETTKLADWSLKHKGIILSLFGTLAAAALIWTFWGFYAESREQKAQTLLFEAEKSVKKVEVPEVPKNPGEAQTPPAVKPTEESYLPALTQLKKVAEENLGTQSAVFAALEYARINLPFKKYDANIDLLEKVKSSASQAITKAIVLHNLAVNYEAKGDCNKAIEIWNQIEGREDMAFLHGNIYLEKGLCYEKLGQKDKAETIYRKAEALGKNPEVAKLAKKYLRMLK